MDQVQLEVAEVELLAEARLGPGLLAGRLRDLAGLPLGDLAGRLLGGCWVLLGHSRRPRPGVPCCWVAVALTLAPVYRGVTCGAVRRRCGGSSGRSGTGLARAGPG